MTPHSESTPAPADAPMADLAADETSSDTADTADTIVPAPVDAQAAEWSGPSDWQRLPLRARRVFLYVALLVAIPPTLMASSVLYGSVPKPLWAWGSIAAAWVVAIALALWVAHKRYHYTFWKLDADGFAVRRGRLWQWETHVPTSRVQHLDLKRGPLERSHRLASLVLHTAGTRLSAVSISGLDDADAERLREHFSRQIDRQEDDDHADA
jgi:uncharacterized protein